MLCYFLVFSAFLLLSCSSDRITSTARLANYLIMAWVLYYRHPKTQLRHFRRIYLSQ